MPVVGLITIILMNSLGKLPNAAKTKNVAYEGPGLIIPY